MKKLLFFVAILFVFSITLVSCEKAEVKSPSSETNPLYESSTYIETYNKMAELFAYTPSKQMHNPLYEQ